MKVQKEKLLHALNQVKPGLATKSIIQQMENVTFTGEDIITYNDQICVLYPFETDFSASINHKDLYKIVTGIKSDSFNMIMKENAVVITSEVEDESTKAELISMVEEELNDNIKSLTEQLPSEENKLEWKELPKDFISGALLCIPAASTDMAHGVLTCLYVNGTDLICSDNMRVSHYEMESNTDVEFFVKATIVRELSHFDFVWFCVAKSWVHFQTENGTIFSVRLIRGKGLDYFKKMFSGFTGVKIELPKEIKELVESASVMAPDDEHNSKHMFISFEKDHIICSTQSDRGVITKKKSIDYNKETPIEFSISATFLQQILGMPLTMVVGDKKSLFESGNFKHVLIHKV